MCLEKHPTEANEYYARDPLTHADLGKTLGSRFPSRGTSPDLLIFFGTGDVELKALSWPGNHLHTLFLILSHGYSFSTSLRSLYTKS